MTTSPNARRKNSADATFSGQDRAYAMLGLRIVGEFGAIIAVPVVALAIAGKWLDARYGTAPMFLIGGFVIAAALSAHMVYRKAQRFKDEYEMIGRSDTNPPNKETDTAKT